MARQHGKLRRGAGCSRAGPHLGAGLPIYWNAMPIRASAQARPGGGVTVFCGSTDIGQGSDSILAYVVAEVLGVDPFEIEVVTADTSLTPVDLGSYSSRVTLMSGNAALQAAERARELLVQALAESWGIPGGRIALADGRALDVEDPDRSIPFAEAVVIAEAKFGTIGTVGSYTPPPSLPVQGAGVGRARVLVRGRRGRGGGRSGDRGDPGRGDLDRP
jgi:CO/xanthine dehydrogenase Mo-binding subunit